MLLTAKKNNLEGIVIGLKYTELHATDPEDFTKGLKQVQLFMGFKWVLSRIEFQDEDINCC